MLVKMDDAVAGEMYVPGATIKMSKTPGRVGPVPTPGQHTDEVLGGLLGYDRATLAEFRAAERHRLTDGGARRGRGLPQRALEYLIDDRCRRAAPTPRATRR